jgi:hypothetical protein
MWGPVGAGAAPPPAARDRAIQLAAR